MLDRRDGQRDKIGQAEGCPRDDNVKPVRCQRAPGGVLRSVLEDVRSGELERAAELLAEELARAPDAAEARFVQGELEAVRDRPALAASELAAALALDPGLAETPTLARDPRVALALADAWARLGRPQLALDQGRRALSLARLAGDARQTRAASNWLAAFRAE